MPVHRLLEQAIHFLLGFRTVCNRLVFNKPEIPIARRLGQFFHARINRDRRPCGQHFYARKQRIVRDEILERHIFGEMRRVELRFEARELHERLDLGAEQKRLAIKPIVKRLHAISVTRKRQPPIGPIPNRQRKHAVEF